MRTGVSPLVSTVIVLAIAFGAAAFVTPWMGNLVTGVTEQTGQTTTTQILCENLAYDFDTSYGTDGVSWNFTEFNDTLTTKIRNTGGVNVFNFSFELTVWNETLGERIYRFYPTPDTQTTQVDPLLPGQSTILEAYITRDVEGILRGIKILNGPCPSKYAHNPYL